MPSIRPLPIKHAKKIMEIWHLEAKINNDLERCHTLSHGMAMCRVEPNDNIGCIALAQPDICAISLLEKIPLENDYIIMLWHVESKDFHSGSLMIEAITKVSKVRPSYILHNRWKIALSFYK